MRLGGAAIIGAAALLAAGVGAARPDWRWPALPAGVATPIVPADNGMSAVKVALGRRLFYDPALSADGSMACADCHQQDKGFADGLATHRGVMGEMGVRNVPGLANVAWRGGLTWTEAGLTTLEQQAMVPMTGTKPVEMGLAQDDAVIARLMARDPCYRRMFALAFPGDRAGGSFAKVTAALAAFQRTMISYGSAHDRGRSSPLARRGAAQFMGAGCATCHSGPDFTDGKTHYVGTSAPREADSAAYGGKPLPPGFEAPPEQFRTPSLRNVAVTGPWLHDGQSSTIESAIRRHAAPMLVDVDMPALLAFLDALTDHDFLKNSALSRPAATCPIPA